MTNQHRRAFRHAIDLSCSIVRERDFRQIAVRAVDLSTDGMLVPTDLRVLTGEPVLVSFRLARASRWIDTEAVVARVVHGRRPGDHGRRLGLAFQGLDDEVRHALFQELRRMPSASPRLGSRRVHVRRADLS